ncbi:MAG: 2Fe-2S iron-sulfur cluster-binding protein [Actinomycetota bacterium]
MAVRSEQAQAPSQREEAMAIRLDIDDVEVAAEPGESVLKVARRNGFDIPALCYHEAVPSIGACRVCLVEVRKGAETLLSTSCNLPAEEGMQVVTDSPEIRRHRAMNLELMLSRAPGAPGLRKLAAEYGVVRPRFAPVAEGGIRNCILCELCVRVCDMLGHHALAAVGHGDEKTISPPFGKPAESCVGCGSCLSVCPTRCVAMRDTATTRTIWGKTFDFRLCSECGAPLITEAHREFAIAEKGLPEDYYDVCQACKQSVASKTFASVVW